MRNFALEAAAMKESKVDIRGLICPAPVIEITRIARTLAEGDVLVVIMGLDGKTNVEGWARGNNFEITGFKKEENIVFTLKKRGGAQFYACDTTMALMGLTKEDFIDEVKDMADVTGYLETASESDVTLFI